MDVPGQVIHALAFVAALCTAAPAVAADADAQKKSSPYAEANKRHVDPKTGKPAPTTKRFAASGRAHSSPVRRKH
jgi:hypothetical protein